MTPVGLALHRTFHSLHTRNFRIYFIGQVVSVTGTWINATASAWLVLTITNSGFALGVNTALTFLPILLIGAFGGLMADRFDKRKILIGTQIAYAVLALTLFALVQTDVVQLWMVYALSFGAGIVTALDNPTRQSFYIELVGEKDLTNAVSLNSAVFTGTRILGPALAGLMILAGGTALCFLVDGISYIAVIGALLAMRTRDLHAQKRAEGDGAGIREGFRYVWESPELRRPLLVMTVVFTLSFNFSVLVPLLAKQTFGGTAGTFGTMSALGGLGSFIGALVMANRASARGSVPNLRRLGIFAFASGATFALTAVAPTLWWAYVSMVPLGLTIMIFIITGNSMLQLASRPELRGRVMAIYGMVFLGSTPVGAIIVGWLGEVSGARAGFALAALAAFAAGAGALWWQRMPASRPVEALVEAELEPPLSV
jgi:MFS family permease